MTRRILQSTKSNEITNYFAGHSLSRLKSYGLKVKILTSQLGLTPCDSEDCSPPGSSVRGILQARILEWVAISSFRESSQPRDQTQVSCTEGGFFFLASESP